MSAANGASGAAVPPRPVALRPRLSVVVATYNRVDLIQRLLGQFARQTLPASDFEVVVVDDGSREPAAPHLEKLTLPFSLRVETQANAGAAAARHRGVIAARGEVVLITDDDMQVAEDFLAKHLARHPRGSRNVVIGSIRPDPAISNMPLFERWYAWLNNRIAASMSGPKRRAHGWQLFTGNVSFRREDYVAAGGFDKSLGQSEDIELGLRLEKAGCRFEFCTEAYVLHGSDHTSFEKWLKRANRYGVFDIRVAAKHPDVPQVSPWRYLFEMNPLARPLLAAVVMAPEATRPVTHVVMGWARLADKVGLQKAAFAGTSVSYVMEYLRGARTEAGSLSKAARHVARFAFTSGKPGQVLKLAKALKDDAVQVASSEYGQPGVKAVAAMVLTSDGYRVLALQRLREAARGLGIPLGNHALRVAQTAVLGVEIGKDVELGSGVYFVHSLGTVVGGDAKVGNRVRFYGNNTVGTAKDDGYPVIEDDVWVGAGARILGPITVGARSRIGANAVVLQDIPPDSVAVGIPARIIPRKDVDGE
ncbi:exopolysaccharide biosynthesis glycosyltransferase EpsD [Archangium lansingense]|uniref:Glycosyltransferase n=1 Tax=Archangium lansingense TaxID=2995310 RepID=A0ABT3ZTW4_9BACT|nr:exopolysaccharide biosynthesis glycosyltransferase EpsD [Archangium lansinium]MCY1072855.1 glycosyltransferase [Archangium lansinium]